jgi:hypothetical protein
MRIIKTLLLPLLRMVDGVTTSISYNGDGDSRFRGYQDEVDLNDR